MSVFFTLILLGIPSSLILSIKKRVGGGRGLLSRQNLSSVTKAICLQSLGDPISAEGCINMIYILVKLTFLLKV